MKYKPNDVVWTAAGLDSFTGDAYEPYQTVIVAGVFDTDVSSVVHYVTKTYTCVDNYFYLTKETCLFSTKEECQKVVNERNRKNKEAKCKVKEFVNEFRI